MLKEAKVIDFFTTGRQPSEQDFTRISEWINKKKIAATRRARKSSKKINSPQAAIVPIKRKKDR